MKKLKLIFLCIILLMPVLIKADSTFKYQARVKNKDGTVLELIDEFGTTIEAKNVPYKTALLVLSENYSQENGCIMAKVEYKDNVYFVKLEDLEATEKVDLKKMTSCENELYVYQNSAILYKGPSTSYGKLNSNAEIPIGTKLKCNYKTTIGESSIWSYVSYANESGWIYTDYTCNGGYNNCPNVLELSIEPAIYEVLRSAVIYSDSELKTSILEIPALSKIKYLGYTKNSIFVEYEDNQGFIDDQFLFLVNDYYEKMLTENLKMYDLTAAYEEKKAGHNFCETLAPIMIIPKKTKVSLASIPSKDFEAFYLTYEGIKGIIYEGCQAASDSELDNFQKLRDSENIEIEKEGKEPAVKNKASYLLMVLGVIFIATAIMLLVINLKQKNSKLSN